MAFTLGSLVVRTLNAVDPPLSICSEDAKSLKLLGRMTRPADLDQCIDLLRNRFLYDARALRDLRKMWLTIISEDVGRSAVVFDARQPERVLAFSVSVAISEERFDEIVRNGAPFIGRSLFDDWRSERDPFLGEAAFEEANVRGNLYIAVPYNGVDETLDANTLVGALSALSEQFVSQHAGVNLKALVHEAYGVPVEHAADLGMQVIPYRHTYSSELGDLPMHLKPILLMTTRDEARRHPANLVLHQLFLRFTPPQCGLGKTERRLLRFAAEGLPDRTIAEALSISPSTLKKRWSLVYASMESVIGIVSGCQTGQRGAELRRHVLRYIRQHPEELHAYAMRERVTRGRSYAELR